MDAAIAEMWRLLLKSLGIMNENLETIMVDTSKLAADLASLVSGVKAKFDTLSKQVTDLQAAVAANDPAATQAAVDVIDKSVTDAKTSFGL